MRRSKFTEEQIAMVPRRLLGKIRMEPTQGDIGRPYYVAKTSIDALAILDDPNEKNCRGGGSNYSRWWSRRESALRHGNGAWP